MEQDIGKADSSERCDSKRLLFITANTGSLFEASSLEAGWMREVVAEVQQWKPAFFALHMQEIGGKNYRTCMRLVRGFIHDLRDSFSKYGYTHGKVFLDEEFDAVDRFTALGSAYFCHHDFVKRVNIYDFQKDSFQPLSGFEICVLNEHTDPTAERKRFPKTMFTEIKWSRKGFMRTRWRVDQWSFDLVNIHLFHDTCNLLAVEQSPSVYSSHRRQALTYTLNEIGQTTPTTNTPMFMFGDFNFRLDARSFIESLAPMCHQQPIQDGNAVVKVEYRRLKSSECILSIGTKTFEHENHDKLQHSELLQFDRELTMYPELSEWPISFPPSYPYSEDADSPTMYMRTRVPSWCDRVLMNEAAWNFVQLSSKTVRYHTIGQATCMGDHKPVYLTFSLPTSGSTRSTTENAVSATLEKSCVGIYKRLFAQRSLEVIGENIPSESHFELYGKCPGTYSIIRGQSPFMATHTSIREEPEDPVDYVTMITLHDDKTVTVMDASSYGLSFNSSWNGTLIGNSTRRLEETTDLEAGDDLKREDYDEMKGSLIGIRSRIGSRDYGASCLIDGKDDNRIRPPPPLFPPPPPPSTPEAFLTLREFNTGGDSVLISSKRSISSQYPYYSELSCRKGDCGKPDGVYAMPFPVSPPASASCYLGKELAVKKSLGDGTELRTNGQQSLIVSNGKRNSSLMRIGKGVQVEFALTSIRAVMMDKNESGANGEIRKRSVNIQTDPAITRDNNCLEQELERRRTVGLDRWAFDERWDIIREFFTEERQSTMPLEAPRAKMVTIDEAPYVQRRPISVKDRKMEERRRKLEKKKTNCTCL